MEERLSALSDEERVAAQKEGALGALGKITQAGYASLDVRDLLRSVSCTILTRFISSLSGTLLVGLMKLGHGRLDGVQRRRRLLVSSSMFFCTRSAFLLSTESLSSSDFENKFVCGEIMSYDDLKEHGSETAVKAAGKLRQQGKPYESKFHFLCRCFCFCLCDADLVVDGDIAYWKSGA